MTTSEELNRLSTVPYLAAYYALLRQASTELEALHKENEDLKASVAHLHENRRMKIEAYQERDQLRAEVEALKRAPDKEETRSIQAAWVEGITSGE